MSDSKHTPGPWTANRRGTQGVANYTVIGTPTNAHTEIARVYHGNRFADGDANAALIAAAPDLLAALRQFANMAGRVPKNDSNTIFIDHRSWQAFQADARAAIAKAEGRS